MLESKMIEDFKNGFISIKELTENYGSVEITLERLRFFGIDLLDCDNEMLNKLDK